VLFRSHLLFVFGLFVLLYQQRRKMLLAVTAFTVGHSASLFVIGLDFAPAMGIWIEILIALSITFLALEILNESANANGNINTNNVVFGIKNHPYRLTAFFGLIHGCGFALVLKEMLSNTSDKLLPLISFNVGIELGQCIMLVLFMGASVLLNKLDYLSRYKIKYPVLLKRVSRLVMPFCGYSLGVMSMYWVVLRGFL